MCSPFHRHIFLSVGVDGTLRVRSVLEKQPLISATSIIDRTEHSCMPVALYAADWSKIRPLVFAVAGDDGIVRIYDLSNTQSMIPAAELDIPVVSNSTRSRICALQFNPKQRDFFACGDADGHIHIWQLSWGLSNAGPFEQGLLQSYIERTEQ